MSLTLGLVFGDPIADQTPMGRALVDILRRKPEEHEQGVISEQAMLNVVFHIPGRHSKPDYQGIRTGRFSKKEKGYMIQVAVPESLVTSGDPDRFIFDALREAIAIAKPRFEKHNLEFSVAEHLQFVQALEDDRKYDRNVSS